MSIQFTKKQIKLLKKLGIEVIYLFGSQVSGYVTKRSDIDLGIVFRNPQKYYNHTLEVYNKLFCEFSTTGDKRATVDIIFLQFTPTRLQMRAIKEGRVAFESNQDRRIAYEEMIMKKHADLSYFIHLRHQAILQRI